MDYRKFYKENELLLLAIVVGGMPATIVRQYFINIVDVGTANLICIIVFVVCIIAQREILVFIEDFILPLILKKIFNKKESAPVTQTEVKEEKESAPVTQTEMKEEKKSAPVTQIEVKEEKKSVPVTQTEVKEDSNEKEKDPWKTYIDNIRLDYENQYLKEQNEKVDLFLKYSHQTMAPYVTNDELLLLDEYIRYYSFKELLPEKLTPIKPSKLKNPDMYHFGWNMSNYFEGKKEDVSPWLKKVFFQLMNEDIKNITKKLRHSQNIKYNIPIVEDIPKYLEEQKKLKNIYFRR